MSTPSEHVAEEPQEERGAPGSRDTGADRPSAGPADRPSGTYEGDESVPTYGDEEKPEFDTRMTEQPPKDAEPAVPPYEGRKEAAEPTGTESERAGGETRGAARPVADPDYKSPPPGETPGGQPHHRRPNNRKAVSALGTSGTGRAA